MRLRRNQRRFLLLVAVLYFTFVGGTFMTDHRFGPRVAHHAIVTLMLAAWAFARTRRPRVLPLTALDGPLAAYFLANVLATVFAVDPRISLEFLWRLAVHIWLYYAIAGLFARGHGRDVFEALFLASGVVVLIGLFEFASWYFGLSWVLPFDQSWLSIGGLADPIPPRIYRLNFTLGFSTGLSAYLAVLIPLGLAFALTGRTRDTRRAFWLWLVGALAVEGLSFSRGGLLSLAVSLPTFAALALLGDAELRARLWQRAKNPRVMAALGVILVIVVIFGFGWTRQMLSGHRTGDEVRLELWRSALVIFRQKPLFGVGPYGFGRAFRRVRDPLITRLVLSDRHLTADNRLLTTLAETGLPGGLALLWLCVRFFRIGYDRWHAASSGARLRIAGACAAVIGFGVHNLVDAFTATPVLLPMLILTAFVAHHAEGAPTPTRVNSLPLVGDSSASLRRLRTGFGWGLKRLALLTLVALSALGWLLSDWAQFHFQRSLLLAGRSDLDGALAEIERAQAIDPALDLYAFQRAYLLSLMADQDPALLDDAVHAYEAALSLEDTSDFHRANMSMLYERSGEMEAARAEMEAASNIVSKDTQYLFWTGGYAEAAGDYDAATDWYWTTLRDRPEWAGSSYWEGTPWREAFLSGYLASAGPDGAKQLLAAGHEEAALEMAQQAAQDRPGDVIAHLTLGEVALHTGDAGEALSALDAALVLDPASSMAYALRAEARLALGDSEGAERDANTTLFLGSSLDAGLRARYVLAQLAEADGDLEAAEAMYRDSGPLIVLSQGWDVAVYGRKADFRPLPWLKAPGPGRFAFDPWLSLAELYESQGRHDEAQGIYDLIQDYDTFD
jgi:tetratricopeptide (TPR) repeat protein/O-antigen ligase